MTSQDAASKTKEIQTSIFSDKKFRTIFSLAKNYWKTSKTLTSKMMVLDKIKSAGLPSDIVEKYKLLLNKISKEAKILSVNDFEYLLTELTKSSQVRRAFKAMSDGTDILDRGKIKEGLRFVQLEFGKIEQEEKGKLVREGDYFKSFEKRKEFVKKRRKKKIVGVPTGIRKFDEFFGGILPEELGIIQGGTAIGKSIALLSIGIGAFLRRFNVIIVTVEMSKMQYEFRIDSRLTGIISRKFRLGKLTKGEFHIWKSKIKKYRKLPNSLWVIDIPRNATVDLIELKMLEAMREIGGKFLLIVDYLNILQPSKGRYSSRMDWQAQGDIVKSLKELAREYHIPIWTAAQPTRKSARKAFMTTEDIGFSYIISQDADFVLSLIQTKEDELEGKLKLVCTKGREGKMPPIEMHPDFDRILLDCPFYREEEKE